MAGSNTVCIALCVPIAYCMAGSTAYFVVLYLILITNVIVICRYITRNAYLRSYHMCALHTHAHTPKTVPANVRHGNAMHIVCIACSTEQLTSSAHARPITIGSRPALSSSSPASLVWTLLSLLGCVASSGSGAAVVMVLTKRECRPSSVYGAVSDSWMTLTAFSCSAVFCCSVLRLAVLRMSFLSRSAIWAQAGSASA